LKRLINSLVAFAEDGVSAHKLIIRHHGAVVKCLIRLDATLALFKLTNTAIAPQGFQGCDLAVLFSSA